MSAIPIDVDEDEAVDPEELRRRPMQGQGILPIDNLGNEMPDMASHTAPIPVRRPMQPSSSQPIPIATGPRRALAVGGAADNPQEIPSGVIGSSPRQVIPVGGAPRPQVMSSGGIPVTPQTRGGIIPTDPSSGQVEQVNNKGIPIKAGIAGLWAKADNIHNPVLRVLGKIGTGALKAIDIAGAAALPGVEARIPGSEGYEKAVENRRLAVGQEEAKTGLENAQTARVNQEVADSGKPKPKEEDWEVLQGYKGPNGEPVEREKNSGTIRTGELPQGVTGEPSKGTVHETDQGMIMVHPDGSATALTMNGKPLMGKSGQKNTSEQIKAGIKDAFEKGDTATVKKLQDELKATDPEGAQRIQIQLANQETAKKKANRADVAAHDKAYVQPAEAVEKSYQMADKAYKEFTAARKAGKELDTGAPSMVELSTHLSTTFGNVKGARITKDMIEHHLGARSISDDMLAAVQKLTNGDTLSPAQWKAFHHLIGQSRELTWQIAAKEADRKGIDVDFLPKDLANISHEPGDTGGTPSVGDVIQARDQQGKLHEAPKGTKLPAGWKLEK